MGAAPTLQTFEELYAWICALPEGQHGEILGPGWARMMPRPGGTHSMAARALSRRLGDADTIHGGAWWIDIEREILFPSGKLFVPDLVGWRVGDGDLAFVHDNPVTRVPDWACEILSRSNQRGDRAFKLPTYIGAGVAHVWVVDPEVGTIEVYAPSQGLPALVATVLGDERKELPPFGLPICMTELLAMRPLPPTEPAPG